MGVFFVFKRNNFIKSEKNLIFKHRTTLIKLCQQLHHQVTRG
jgi:hypothetical protein